MKQKACSHLGITTIQNHTEGQPGRISQGMWKHKTKAAVPENTSTQKKVYILAISRTFFNKLVAITLKRLFYLQNY